MNFGGSGIMRETFLHIRSILPEGKTILEIGSGDVSTQHLSKHYKLYSVEDKEEWLNKHPSTYIHAPLVDGWYSLDALRALPFEYDLILVDGPTGEGNRGGFLKHLDLFRKDVIIIFDDTNRLTERQLAIDVAHKLNREITFHSTFAVVGLQRYR